MEWIEQKETKHPSTWIYKNGSIELARVYYNPQAIELNKYSSARYKPYSYDIHLPGIPGSKWQGVETAEEGIAIVESAVDQWLLDANLTVTYR